MIQTKLKHLYHELEDLGYQEGHKKAILRLLWDLQLHHSDDIANAGGKQYNARVLELRRDGWDITTYRVGKVRFYFKLNSHEKLFI